ALEETARRYFPRATTQAANDGSLAQGRKACVRPFTCTGLGIFDVSATADGGRVVIASGHNTGGFAQSPAVADAVALTLAGQPHPMQALYDPERGILPDYLMD
ncbi:MAG: FAD-binding oxidoreductase, partial [Acidobacteriota bacterium]